MKVLRSSGLSDGTWQGRALDSSHQCGKCGPLPSGLRPNRANAHRLPAWNPDDLSTRPRRLLKANGFGGPEQSRRRGKPSSRNGGIECSSAPSRFDAPPRTVATGTIRATDEVCLNAATGFSRPRKLASSPLPHRYRVNRVCPSRKGPSPRLGESHACQLLDEAGFGLQQLLHRRRVRPGEEVPRRDLSS